MNDNELDIFFFSKVSHIHYNCSQSVRLGNQDDGGWNACISEPYFLREPCLVYSFGINYDFSFDDAVAATFGCKVRSFDPSMLKVGNHTRGAHIWFYKLGIGGRNKTDSRGWTFSTLSSLLSHFNDTHIVMDYLKMDVEGAEWASLTNMYATGVLQNVKQLGMEIHVTRNPKDFLRFWSVLDTLEQLGFRRWYFAINTVAYNPYKIRGELRSHCYEMVYVNSRFLARSESRPLSSCKYCKYFTCATVLVVLCRLL
jgi:hypothetical protein